MQANATEGIRLDMKLDTWPVSVNVAMPAGLVVNELLTNSLKHAFAGREGGAVKLHSLIDDHGYHIMVADDGVGLPEGTEWPEARKTWRDHCSVAKAKRFCENCGSVIARERRERDHIVCQSRIYWFIRMAFRLHSGFPRSAEA